MSNVYLGWDVGGTKSALVVAGGEGEVFDRVEWPSRVELGPQAMIAEFLGRALAMRARYAGIHQLGVSIGGPLDTRNGVVLSPPHLPGWDNVPLCDILKSELGLAVVVEHDAAACLEAEWLWGAAAGTTHAAYLTCGTGCGAGLMIEGRIVRGPSGQSPELGHIRLAADGPMMFGKKGCVESFCSGEGIGKLAGWMFPRRWLGPVPPRELHELRCRGDADAAAVLDESARRTGQLCAILADAFAVQVIVLGSLARYFGREWVDAVAAEFRREALPVNARDTRIVPAGLGERLQDLSAVAPCVFGALRSG